MEKAKQMGTAKWMSKLLFAVMLLSLLALAACSQEAPPAGSDSETQVVPVASDASDMTGMTIRKELITTSTIEEVLRRGTLRVGFDTFVPWAMKNKKGEFIGFEIDVARRLAKDMGVKLELVPTKWSGIIPALLTGKFDVLIGGMGIRVDRAKKVNFTIPYYSTGLSLVASKTKAPGLTRLEDFNKPNITVVTRTGTTPAKAAEKMLPNAKHVHFDAEPQCLQEMLSGRADAFISSAPLPAHTAADYPDKAYMPFTENFTNEPNGFAIRKGDVDTLAFFNSWITMTKAEGWIKERQQYWFGTKDWADEVK